MPPHEKKNSVNSFLCGSRDRWPTTTVTEHSALRGNSFTWLENDVTAVFTLAAVDNQLQLHTIVAKSSPLAINWDKEISERQTVTQVAYTTGLFNVIFDPKSRLWTSFSSCKENIDSDEMILSQRGTKTNKKNRSLIFCMLIVNVMGVKSGFKKNQNQFVSNRQ